MALADDLILGVRKIAIDRWNEVDGQVVPESEDIGLGNEGTNLDAAMLCSDLAESTAMILHSRSIAAEVFKSFLLRCSRIILGRNGYVRSFDGDRVMGVSIGDYKNTNAAKAALNINWAVTQVIEPQFKMYDAFKHGSLRLAHCTVDRSEVLVARAGIRNNNDLVWVGRAANVAAKLSGVRQTPYASWITKAVHDAMNEEAKKSFSGQMMWQSATWTALPQGAQDLYRSSWWWKPD